MQIIQTLQPIYSYNTQTTKPSELLQSRRDMGYYNNIMRAGRCVPLCAAVCRSGAIIYMYVPVVRCAACCAVIAAPGNPGQPRAGEGAIAILMLYIPLIKGWGITLLVNLGISL